MIFLTIFYIFYKSGIKTDSTPYLLQIGTLRQFFKLLMLNNYFWTTHCLHRENRLQTIK